MVEVFSVHDSIAINLSLKQVAVKTTSCFWQRHLEIFLGSDILHFFFDLLLRTSGSCYNIKDLMQNSTVFCSMGFPIKDL